jgi:hypothetical protein
MLTPKNTDALRGWGVLQADDRQVTAFVDISVLACHSYFLARAQTLLLLCFKVRGIFRIPKMPR